MLFYNRLRNYKKNGRNHQIRPNFFQKFIVGILSKKIPPFLKPPKKWCKCDFLENGAGLHLIS